MTSETPVNITIDGRIVEVETGTTIHGACTAAGIETPTLCWAENLTPVNVCRVCVVELEGSRAFVPSCSRVAEDGMIVQTDSERVRHSRKMVLEFLGSGVDLSQATELDRWVEAYGADPDRYGTEDHPVERIDEPVKIQDELYIRDYDKCVLCYKCVEACGDDAQHTFAIAVAGRGFDARISTEFDVTLPRFCLRLLRKLRRCVPDRRTSVQDRVRHASSRELATRGPVGHPDGVLVLRCRVQPRPARARRPHRQGHVARRSLGHERPPLHQGSLRLVLRPRRMNNHEARWM